MKDSIQEQLVSARRNQIIDAAAKVFAEKGFHPTTIKDIAREAGIADGTIYNYFENKTALLFGILDRMKEAAQQEADLSDFAEMDARTFMKAYLRHPLMALKTDNFELFRIVISEIMVNREVRELYYRQILEPTLAVAEAHFQKWAEQGIIKPVDVKLAVSTISGMVLGLMMAHIIGDETVTSKWDELPDFLSDLLMDGLTSEQ